MLDAMSHAYSQMQPGDKMVMHLHKSQQPPATQYAMPQASPNIPAGPAAPSMSAPAMTAPSGPITDSPMGVDPTLQRQMLLRALSQRYPAQV